MVAATLKLLAPVETHPHAAMLEKVAALIQSTDVSVWRNPGGEWLGDQYPFAKDYVYSDATGEISIGLELSTDIDPKTLRPRGYVPTLKMEGLSLQGPEIDALYIELNGDAKAKWKALEAKVSGFADDLPAKFSFGGGARFNRIQVGGMVEMPDGKSQVLTDDTASTIIAFRGVVSGYEIQTGRFVKYEPIGAGLRRDSHFVHVTLRQGPYHATAIRSGDQVEVLFSQIAADKPATGSLDLVGALKNPFTVPRF